MSDIDAPCLFAIGERTPQLDAGAWIAPRSTIIGSVSIGEQSSVWYHAVIRGDNEQITLGARSNVQDGCILHADPGFPVEIGDDVTLGHGAIVHGARIGDGTLIGMGAQVLNGAKLGRQCLVAAGTLVPEGFEAPDRSLVVGLPAKVRREVTEEDLDLLAEAAEEYVQLAEVHRSGVRRIDMKDHS